MDKIKVFKTLLDKFETDEIRNYCKDMIKEIPDYIFTIPSSTSLKYHNKTQCQQHGQIFHILMFGEILNYILELEYAQSKYSNLIRRDCMRCVPIFHDAIKCGLNGSKYTVHQHPLLAANWIKTTIVEHDIEQRYKEYIAHLCERHSGQWIENKKSNIILPKPENDDEFLIHLCDYLSSRSNLDMIYSDEICEVLSEIKAPEVEIPKLDEYVFDFGKYKGEKLIDVAKSDSDYIPWMKENIYREPIKSLLEQLNEKEDVI